MCLNACAACQMVWIARSGRLTFLKPWSILGWCTGCTSNMCIKLATSRMSIALNGSSIWFWARFGAAVIHSRINRFKKAWRVIWKNRHTMSVLACISTSCRNGLIRTFRTVIKSWKTSLTTASRRLTLIALARTRRMRTLKSWRHII